MGGGGGGGSGKVKVLLSYLDKSITLTPSAVCDEHKQRCSPTLAGDQLDRGESAPSQQGGHTGPSWWKLPAVQF